LELLTNQILPSTGPEHLVTSSRDAIVAPFLLPRERRRRSPLQPRTEHCGR
jgi:hypothetical protein